LPKLQQDKIRFKKYNDNIPMIDTKAEYHRFSYNTNRFSESDNLLILLLLLVLLLQ